MKCLLLWIIWGGSIVAVSADEQLPEPVRKPLAEERRAPMEDLRKRNPEAFEKLREELKSLSPEERQKRLREFREKHGTPVRDELEKRREELQKLPPEERQAKMKVLREQIMERRKAMTEEERRAKRGEIKSRLERQLGELRQKKTNGTLTPLESKRLQRLETVGQRFKEAQVNGASDPSPEKR
jgi:hypothetical protein